MFFLSFPLQEMWYKAPGYSIRIGLAMDRAISRRKEFANFQGLMPEIISFGKMEYLMKSDLGNKNLV